MSAPRTGAGRALADRAVGLWWQPNPLAGANAMQSATREVHAAILAIEDEAAALAATPPLDDLSAAWAEAEAALPTEGREVRIDGLSFQKGKDGEPDQRYPDHWVVNARLGYTAGGAVIRQYAVGPTPAAALRSLAAALSPTGDET